MSHPSVSLASLPLLHHPPGGQVSTYSEAALLAVLASVVVALLAGVMATMAWKSYRATGNQRLVFVVLAFSVFALKSAFIGFNVYTHTVAHDAIEFVGALFDLIIVVLLFTPFFLATPAGSPRG